MSVRRVLRDALATVQKDVTFGDPRLPEFFWARVIEQPDGCWTWTRSVDSSGYGKFQVRRKDFRAHRVAYEALIGPIPQGLQLDHLCHDPEVCDLGNLCPHRRCANPAHLEPVTHVVNVRRGNNAQRAKTTCINGHPFDEANTYLRPGGGRRCRTCANAASRSYRREASQ